MVGVFSRSNGHSNGCLLEERNQKYRLVLAYMNETIYKKALRQAQLNWYN